MKKNNFFSLPHVDSGLICNRNRINGIYLTLPFKGISLNVYKKMHFSRIKKERDAYRAVISVLIMTLILRNYFDFVGGDGVKLKESIFRGKCHVEWLLSFMLSQKRDPSNYTQKIMLDSIVDVGLLTNDSQDYVYDDKVMIGGKGDCDLVTCILIGDVKSGLINPSVNNKLTHYQLLKKYKFDGGDYESN